MTRRHATLFGSVVITAILLVAGYLLFGPVGAVTSENTGTDDEVTILVATKNLNMGEIIKLPEEMFVEKKFAKGDEPPGAIDSFERLKNRMLWRPLRAGDFITQEDIMPREETFLNKVRRYIGL